MGQATSSEKQTAENLRKYETVELTCGGDYIACPHCPGNIDNDSSFNICGKCATIYDGCMQTSCHVNLGCTDDIMIAMYVVGFGPHRTIEKFDFQGISSEIYKEYTKINNGCYLLFCPCCNNIKLDNLSGNWDWDSNNSTPLSCDYFQNAQLYQNFINELELVKLLRTK